ncbi:MAG: FliM/FliN family flagellar motor switch protein [Actinomycetota bacterium]
MAQTNEPVDLNPFEQIRLLNEERARYFFRASEDLAERLSEVLSKWLSDLHISPCQPEEVLIPELAVEDSDIVVVTLEEHLSHGVIVTDLNLALSIITTLCGGNPNPPPEIRPLTRLETGVYKLILNPILHHGAQLLMAGPAVTSAHVNSASALPDSKAEPGVAMHLDIRMGEIEGRITLGFTAAHLQTFVEDVDRRIAGRVAAKKDTPNRQMATATRSVPLDLIVGFEPIRVPAGVLADLQVGDVLRTGQMLSQSLVARVGSERIFAVRAAQRGQRLVAEVTGRIASKEGVQ